LHAAVRTPCVQPTLRQQQLGQPLRLRDKRRMPAVEAQHPYARAAIDRPLLLRRNQSLIALTNDVGSRHVIESPRYEPDPLGQRGIRLRCETLESGRSV